MIANKLFNNDPRSSIERRIFDVCRNGLLNGRGTYSWPDGGLYENKFRDIRRRGSGRRCSADGAIYDGECRNDMLNARGTYAWPDGAVYEGEWSNGKRHGHGTYTWPDGTMYEGEWSENVLQGHGRLLWPGGQEHEGDDLMSLYDTDTGGEGDSHDSRTAASLLLRPPPPPPPPHRGPEPEACPELEAIARVKRLSTGADCLYDPSLVPFDYLARCTAQWGAESEGRLLGEGVFGKVYLAVDVEAEFRFVVKKLNLRSLAALYEQDAAAKVAAKMQANEIVTLSRFRRCPHVVRLLGFTDPSAENRLLCLAYEYCAGGALDRALGDDLKAWELTYRQRLRIALGVVKGLNYLHKGGGGGEGEGEGDRCWHRDVKSANICLTATLEAKLIDCGLAKFMPAAGEECSDQMSSIAGRVGTVGYRCPDYDAGESFGESTEVFALGVVLLELALGQVTLVGQNRSNLYLHFIKRKREDVLEHFDPRAEGDGTWPAELKRQWAQLIIDCLQDDPAARLGISAILQQLVKMAQAHGQMTVSEQVLRDMRLEVERSREAEHFKEARSLIELRMCVFCMEESAVTEGVECGNEETKHFLCTDCFNYHVEQEDKKAKNDIMQRDNRIHCPCGSPGPHGTVVPCTVYSDLEITRALARYPDTYANHVLNYAKLERWRLENHGTGDHWKREQELLHAVRDEKRQRDLMEQRFNELVLANAILEANAEAERRAKEQIRATEERLQQEAAASETLIAITSKPCPGCGTGITHWHGHACHHIKPSGGCPNCHQHFCFACERPRDQFASSCSCKFFCSGTDIAAHTRERSGFRYDDRCGCLYCNECAPGQPCELCDGDCVVCKGVVPPNPAVVV